MEAGGGIYAWSFNAISITNGDIEGTSYLATSNPWIWQPWNLPWVIKRLNNAKTQYRDFTSSSWFNQYWSNTVKWTIEEDKWEIVINGNTLSWTCTADEKQFIGSLFDNQNLLFALWVIRAGVEWTCTVLYKPN